MGIYKEGDFDCLEKLLRPVKKVNDKDLQTLRVEDVEERIRLWNEIKENLSKYEDWECGEFLRDVHSRTLAEFKMAQLRLAATFSMNREEVAGAEKLFTQKEIELLKKLEKYNSFDIKDEEDVIGEIRRGNKTTISYIEDYMREMEGDLDKVLNDPEIKLPVRLAIKETMKKRLEVLQAGVLEYMKQGGLSRLPKEAEPYIEGRVSEIKREAEEKVKEKEEILEAERKLLEEKKKELDDRLEKIKKGMGGSEESRFVTRAEAKIMELNYVGRFDKKMNSFPLSIPSPMEGREYRITSWDGHSKQDEREWIEKEFSGMLSRAEIDNEMPCNKRSAYSIWRKHGFFGKKRKRVVLEAMVFNHLEAYAEAGFDTKPLSLEEFTGILSKRVDEAEIGNYFHVLGIASPTGISEKIKEYLQTEEFHRRFVNRYVSVCLVDLTTGETVYNPSDTGISRFVEFFKPQFNVEKVEKVKKFIADKFTTASYIVLEDVFKETKEDRSIIKKAFYDYEEEGYRARYIEGVGLVLLEAER